MLYNIPFHPPAIGLQFTSFAQRMLNTSTVPATLFVLVFPPLRNATTPVREILMFGNYFITD